MKEIFTSSTKQGLDDNINEFIENHSVIDWPNVTIVTEIVQDDTPCGYHWKATLMPKDTTSALKHLLVEEHGIVQIFWSKQDIIELAAQDNRRELLPSEVDEIARQLADSDECRYVYGGEWTPNTHRTKMVGFEYRRPVPHTGRVQFLMNVSILVPVIVDCDGKTQEEIEVDAGCLAVQKILANSTQYVHLENIDWSECRVDDEEFQPEQENGDY